MDAALRGSREIGFTVLSMSTSLIAVFIPILLMGGIVGRIFREFAITLSAAVAISMVVSLTTTPIMCSAAHEVAKGAQAQLALSRQRARDSKRFMRGTRTVCAGYCDTSRSSSASCRATVALAIYLYIVVPKGFFPQQDTGRINANVLASEDISFQSMEEKMNEYVAIVQNDPAVDIVSAFTGGGGAVNTANLTITLKPLIGTQRRRLCRDQPAAAQAGVACPAPLCSLQAVQDLHIGGRASNAQFQYTLQGDNLKDL